MSDSHLKIKLHPFAELDLSEAALWYDKQKAGLGYEFLVEFDELKELLASFPRIFQFIEPDIRRAILNRFPYIVIYKVYDDHIFIIAIMHGARHPDHWKSRTF